MNKKLIYVIIPGIILFLFSIFIIWEYANYTNSINSNQLMKLVNFKEISGDIVGLSPVDIDVNHKFIENNCITTTSFHQNSPSKHYTVKIKYNRNMYIIEEYLDGINTGEYKLILQGKKLNGYFYDYATKRKYTFNSILTNYTNEVIPLPSDIASKSLVQGMFFNYTLYKGYYISHTTGKYTNKLLLEYNVYTNRIIYYSNLTPKIIIRLKLTKSNGSDNLRLNAYYKDKYIGYFTLTFNISNNRWDGKFINYKKNNQYFYPFVLINYLY